MMGVVPEPLAEGIIVGGVNQTVMLPIRGFNLHSIFDSRQDTRSRDA